MGTAVTGGGEPSALAAGVGAPKLRLLFLTDGRITRGHGPMEFGLGPPIDTLEDRASVPWLDISVDFVDRDSPSGFRLTQAGFDLDVYDQVWMFADQPGEAPASSQSVPDSVAQLPEHAPVSEAELRILAKWMDGGGGVFATGDHSFLGASMCSRIPRVRSMRMWTHSQGVPSLDTPERHETLQRAWPAGYEAWEGDRYAQRIFPVYQPVAAAWAAARVAPHQLLCGPHGVIDHFPDHMHEGRVIEDKDIRLDWPLDIDGYSGEEYPPSRPVVLDASASAPLVVPPPVPRPVPHVVAHGITTNRDAPPRAFGLVGAYEGQSAGVGRVVVDSTWHHWFSLNLHGFMTDAPIIYEQMQWYYRNVAIFLARPEQRARMLFAAIWNGMMSCHPGAFSRGFSVWESGQRVTEVLARDTPQCLVSALVPSVMPQAYSADTSVDTPALSGVDPELVNTAMTGAIALEMVERVNQLLLEQAKGRRADVDQDEVLACGWAGVAHGHAELAQVLGEQARAEETLQVALERMEERRISSP